MLKDGDDAGQIRCWGDNTDGNTAVPAAQSETVFKSIGGGANFTCGVIGTGVDEGKAVCWGTDFDQAVSDTPETDRFDQVSIGKHHAYGIKTDRTVVCWGANTVEDYDNRERNGLPDDRRVLHIAPDEPGRYRIKVLLDPGAECMPKFVGETDEDALDRCSAVFEVTVKRPSAQVPTPIPPRNPDGDIPEVIVAADGTNYQVFTPADGGEFLTENCSFKVPKGAVNDM